MSFSISTVRTFLRFDFLILNFTILIDMFESFLLSARHMVSLLCAVRDPSSRAPTRPSSRLRRSFLLENLALPVAVYGFSSDGVLLRTRFYDLSENSAGCGQYLSDSAMFSVDDLCPLREGRFNMAAAEPNAYIMLMSSININDMVIDVVCYANYRRLLLPGQPRNFRVNRTTRTENFTV